MSGRFKQSIVYLLKSIELNPDDYQTYLFAALSYQNNGDIENAKKYAKMGEEIRLKQQNE